MKRLLHGKYSPAETRLGEMSVTGKRVEALRFYPLTGLIRGVRTVERIYSDIQHLQDQRKKNGKEGFYPRYISYRAVYQGEIETEFPVPLRTSITTAQS